jgi:hypothetical protein
MRFLRVVPEELENLQEYEFYDYETFRLVVMASCTNEGCSFYAKANVSDELRRDPIWKERIKEILREELRFQVAKAKEEREAVRRHQENRAAAWASYYINEPSDKINWRQEGF